MPQPMTYEVLPAHVDHRHSFAISPERDLAEQIAALRQDIAALRADLAPVPSLIITGQEVLEQFRKLTRS